MNLTLIPAPKSIAYQRGDYNIPSVFTIGIPDQSWSTAALELKKTRQIASIHSVSQLCNYDVRFTKCPKLADEEYLLHVDASGIHIQAATPIGAYWAVQTLKQILHQCPNDMIPCLKIYDLPAFKDRGLYYDVSRGRVPKYEELQNMIDILSTSQYTNIFYADLA